MRHATAKKECTHEYIHVCIYICVGTSSVLVFQFKEYIFFFLCRVQEEHFLRVILLIKNEKIKKKKRTKIKKY